MSYYYYLDKVILFLIIVLTITLLSVITVNTINASYSLKSTSEYRSVPLPLNYFKKRKLSVADHLWKNGSTIRIKFMNKPDKNFKIDKNYNTKMVTEPLFKEYLEENFTNDRVIDAIKDIIINRFQPIVNLKFEFVENTDQSNIRIKFFSDDDSSYSMIGSNPDPEAVDENIQTIGLRKFSVDLILQIFGQALGLLYEHRNPALNNPTSNNPFKWADEKVFNKYYEDIIGEGSEEEKKGYRDDYIKLYNNDNNQSKTDFDELSIMMIDIPPELLINRESPPEHNYFLSKKDIEGLNKMYPSTDPTKPLLSPDEFVKKYYKSNPESNPGSDQLVLGLGLGLVAVGIIGLVSNFLLKKQQNAEATEFTAVQAQEAQPILQPQEEEPTNIPLQATVTATSSRRKRKTAVQNLEDDLSPYYRPAASTRESIKPDVLNLKDDGIDFDAV